MPPTDAADRPDQRRSRRTGSPAVDGPPPVALVLPGQGAQQQGMARGLYGVEPAFTAAFDEVLALFGAEGDRLRRDWWSDRPSVPVDHVSRAQPLLFAVNYALGRMVLDWGLRPAALLGHSAGEVAAAALAGIFSLPDTVRLLAERVEFIAQAPPGGMLAVAATAADVAPHLTDEVVVGAVNSPSQVMLAGPDPELSEVARRLRADGFVCVRAKATSGFHSPSVAAACARQIPSFAPVRTNPPSIPVISGYTAAPLTAEQLSDGAFWAMQPAEPVLFWPALDTLLAGGPYQLVEAGPGQSLSALVRRHPAVTPGGSHIQPLLDARPRGPERDRAAALRAAEHFAARGLFPDPGSLDRLRTRLGGAPIPVVGTAIGTAADRPTAPGPAVVRQQPLADGTGVRDAPRILVTGGAGFIGSHYVRSLLNGDHPGTENARVTVVDSLTYAGNPANLPLDHPRLTFVKGDICDQRMLADVVPGHDSVMHFAAESHVDRSLAGAAEFVRTNVGGTQSLLEACLHAGVAKVVHVSTDEVYGSIDEGSWTEESPLLPNSPYAASKAGSDLVARSYWRTHGLDVSVTRCSNNYGPYQHAEKLLPHFTTRLLDGLDVPLYGDGANVREWLHVDDHCRALHLVLTRGRAGEVYNIGGGHHATNADITSRLLELCGADWSRVRRVPDRKGHDRRYSLDDSKIREELGYRPRVPFDRGLGELVAWYRENRAWWQPQPAAA